MESDKQTGRQKDSMGYGGQLSWSRLVFIIESNSTSVHVFAIAFQTRASNCTGTPRVFTPACEGRQHGRFLLHVVL